MPFNRKYKIGDTMLLSPDIVISTQFFDKDGTSLKIEDSAKSKTIPDKIHLQVEATHSGINKNYGNYLPDKLQASSHTWLTPYAKPVIMNHNSSGSCMMDASDPIGRVIKEEFKASAIDATKSTILLTLEITDKAAIEKFMDGRYQTFSIGAYTDSITCGICGKDIVNDEFCGHHRGRKYEKKEKNEDGSETVTKETCIWTFGNFEYDEISVVNSPADELAVTLSIVPVDNQSAADAMQAEANAPEADDEFNNIPNVLDAVDAALAGSIANNGVQDNIKPLPTVGDSDGKTNPATGRVGELCFYTLDELYTYLKDNNNVAKFAKIAGIGDAMKQAATIIEDTRNAMMIAVADANNANNALGDANAKLDTANATIQDMTTQITANKATHDAMVKQNLDLSKLIQSSLIDHLTTIRTLSDSTLSAETVSSELKTLSTKQLYELIKEESAQLKTIQRPVQLHSPGQSDSNGTDAETPGSKQVDVEHSTETLVDAAIDFFLNPSRSL